MICNSFPTWILEKLMKRMGCFLGKFTCKLNLIHNSRELKAPGSTSTGSLGPYFSGDHHWNSLMENHVRKSAITLCIGICIWEHSLRFKLTAQGDSCALTTTEVKWPQSCPAWHSGLFAGVRGCSLSTLRMCFYMLGLPFPQDSMETAQEPPWHIHPAKVLWPERAHHKGGSLPGVTERLASCNGFH